MDTAKQLQKLKQDLAEDKPSRTEDVTRPPSDDGRGREADSPRQIPSAGWKDILWRSWGEVSQQNLFLIAGGVTYAALLALFPGLAALVSLYGLAFDTSQIEIR